MQTYAKTVRNFVMAECKPAICNIFRVQLIDHANFDDIQSTRFFIDRETAERYKERLLVAWKEADAENEYRWPDGSNYASSQCFSFSVDLDEINLWTHK